MINVLGLRYKRVKQSDTRLDWFMFHKIQRMYSDIKNKEERNSAILLTSMSEQEENNRINKELKDSKYNDEKTNLSYKKRIILSDINQI